MILFQEDGWYLLLLWANCLSNNNSKQKFDVSLVGTLLSHTTNAFVLIPAVQICLVRALKERIYQLSVSIFGVRDVNVFFISN